MEDDKSVNNIVYDFTGKVAVITGSASGIGKSIVNRLYHAGAKIVVADMAEKVLFFIPAACPGSPTEIADAVVFLASDSASYINGHNVVIDCGWTSGFNRDF